IHLRSVNKGIQSGTLPPLACSYQSTVMTYPPRHCMSQTIFMQNGSHSSFELPCRSQKSKKTGAFITKQC
ncbi:hypothetical protein, partial [Escherichia coli]|uniref:hypothetical protein n=1 Tax=Escherichia coli TaxID=562 RepID=UPI0019671DDC